MFCTVYLCERFVFSMDFRCSHKQQCGAVLFLQLFYGIGLVHACVCVSVRVCVSACVRVCARDCASVRVRASECVSARARVRVCVLV
jgi:hypothetical protein